MPILLLARLISRAENDTELLHIPVETTGLVYHTNKYQYGHAAAYVYLCTHSTGREEPPLVPWNIQITPQHHFQCMQKAKQTFHIHQGHDNYTQDLIGGGSFGLTETIIVGDVSSHETNLQNLQAQTELAQGKKNRSPHF